MDVSVEPFFELRGGGGAYRPAPWAKSSWSADQLHGRLIAGLLAEAVESLCPESWRCARLTIDLSRPTPLSEVSVETALVRDGRRIRTVQASISAGGEPTARAVGLLVAASAEPPGEVWVSDQWEVPGPDDLDPPEEPFASQLPWEFRAISGAALATAEHTRAWLRDRRPLVGGRVTSPFVQVAMVADAANPLGNSGTRGLRYINADITLHLARYPGGEWTGFDVSTRMASDGVSVSAATLYDREGPVGMSTVTSVANERWGRR